MAWLCGFAGPAGDPHAQPHGPYSSSRCPLLPNEGCELTMRPSLPPPPSLPQSFRLLLLVQSGQEEVQTETRTGGQMALLGMGATRLAADAWPGRDLGTKEAQ